MQSFLYMHVFSKKVEQPVASVNVVLNLENVLFKLVSAIQSSDDLEIVSRMGGRTTGRCAPFSSPAKLRILSQTVYLLNTIHRLVLENRQVTQRELFYRSLSDLHAPSFVDQRVLNRALISLMDTVGCDRHTLGVFTTARGIVACNPDIDTFCLDEFGEFIANLSDHSDGLSITESLTKMHTIQTSAKFVLVVEKDTLFQSLISCDDFFQANPCILVTARGFPDNITIRFLGLLEGICGETLPFVYLGDLDPHGVCIFLTYQRSISSLYWLGLRFADVQTLNLNNSVIGIKMKSVDLAVLNGILENENTPHYIKEDLLQIETLKYEVECLHSMGEFYLAKEWLPSKIARHLSLIEPST